MIFFDYFPDIVINTIALQRYDSNTTLRTNISDAIHTQKPNENMSTGFFAIFPYDLPGFSGSAPYGFEKFRRPRPNRPPECDIIVS